MFETDFQYFSITSRITYEEAKIKFLKSNAEN